MKQKEDIWCGVSKHEEDTDDSRFDIKFSTHINGNWLHKVLSMVLKEGVTTNMIGDELYIDNLPLSKIRRILKESGKV